MEGHGQPCIFASVIHMYSSMNHVHFFHIFYSFYTQCQLRASLFCDTGGGGGGEILEEAGTFSGQALLLSYPYPRGGGVQSRRQAPTHRLVYSTYPISNHRQCNKS